VPTPPGLSDVSLDAAPIEVLLRFAVSAEERQLPDDLDSLTQLLSDQPGCQRCWMGRSTDEPTSWVVGSRWDSVGAYRRAVNYHVKVQASSLLGGANDEPSAFEVLLEIAGDEEVRRPSDRSSPQDDSRIR